MISLTLVSFARGDAPVYGPHGSAASSPSGERGERHAALVFCVVAMVVGGLAALLLI